MTLYSDERGKYTSEQRPHASSRQTVGFPVFVYGAPGEIRTPGLLIRSQSLYPAELRAHTQFT